MAEIVLGMWTTHGPTLSTTPEQWLMRVKADKTRPSHPFRLGNYSFDELKELRKSENLGEQASLEERTRRHGRCQAAIKIMADQWEEVKPDVAVIMGNDQKEIFNADLIPAFTVFTGETLYNEPASPEQIPLMAPGIHEAEAGHNPPEYTEYPGLPELSKLIVETATQEGFDVTQMSKLPVHQNHWSSGVGHAFGYIYRKVMRDNVVPHVPIIQNTFFPPNQPTAKRCFEFGQMVGRAIKAWDSDLKVAVFGSGGMSHFVIDEDLDALFMKALAERNAGVLTSLDERYFQTGTSELKNWIAAAGIIFDTALEGDVIDYVPCYRSEAGTGTANGFVSWS
ncbi:MAG: protocatechuate 3,4-dioxygenase [Kordiimonadaceae bacterium]|jgi:OH-DDVA oxygenase|nr:protocatechuate 3,4-dioxygenase [Kordiimonadaceae bacterium]